MRTLLSWSTGKDAAWALHVLRSTSKHEVVGLFTTVSEASGRVAMHDVRRGLARMQAESTGLPLHEIAIPWPCPNDVYAARMGHLIDRARRDGISAMAFGDLFLADIRAYREERLAGTGIAPLFPLWGRDTRALADEMLAAGLGARIACVDPRRLDRSLAGRPFDAQFIAALPAGVDPCGENGEFHTFATAGPMFAQPIAVRTAEIVERDGFVHADLVADDAIGCRPAPPPGGASG